MKSRSDSAAPWAAKVCRPATAGGLCRERLFRRLDEGRARPVVWVSGPAGSGKTTLLSCYVEARDLPCLWYRADAGDADLATFFHYLGLAAQKAAPTRRNALPHLTSEYLQGIPEFSRNFFEELFSRLESPALLVFDSYQDVPEDAPLHRVLLEGLTRIPQGMSFAFLSRDDPPSAFARLRVSRQLEWIGWNEVRLTQEEFEGIVEQVGFREIPTEASRHLYEKMDGWAAGLQLLLEAARTGSLEPQELEDANPEEIFDYFAGEIFDRLDEETKSFLLKTSFFPFMTAPMAQSLTGDPRADRRLSFLNRHNLFTEKRLHQEPVYQYHPLFREFLADRARGSWSGEEERQIQRAAASLLVESGQPEDAAKLLCEAEDWDGVTGLILTRGRSLVEQGRGQILEGWLRELPAERLKSSPWLLYWLGVCRMPFDAPEAREHFERAFRLFQNRGTDQAGLLLAWSGAVDSILHGLEDYAEVDPWISTLYEIVKGPDEVPPGEVGDHVVASLYAALVVRQPRRVDLPEWEARALALALGTPDVNAAVQILAHASFRKCYSGDSAGAEAVLERLEQTARSGEASPLSRLRCLFAEAFFSNARGLFRRVGELTREGMELAEATGVHAMDFMFLSNGVRASLNADDVAQARALLNRMALSPVKAKRWNQCYHHYLSAAMALREGQVERASRSIDLALELATSAGVCYAQAASHLLKAQVDQECGEEGGALDQLARGEEVASGGGYTQLLLDAHLAEAKFAFDRGADADGAAFLRRGLALGRERGGFVPYLCRPPVLSALCERALDLGIEVAYVQDLVARCGLALRAPRAEVESWPWPLKIYTLGRFELVRGGTPVQFSGKTQQKPLALLKALIALGGHKVSEARLTDALWPDADGYQAHRSFATTLYRLRRLLGEKDALRLAEGLLTLDPRCCWVDAFALERLLGQAEEAEKKGRDPAQAAQGFDSAIALYRGAFLPQEIDASWALPYRERLRSEFIRAIGNHGRRLEQSGRWEEAAGRYQKAVEVDPLVEELYRRLMVCHQRSGRRAEALAVYQRCRKVLGTVLRIEPSPETEAIGRALRNE